MKVLKYLVLSLLALIGILLVVGLCMPKEWSVERTTVVNAEPAKLYPHVGNLEGWPQWMPCMEIDPAMTFTFEGSDGAPGSRMLWKSEKMGNGWMAVVRSDVATGLDYELMMDGFEEPTHGSIHYAAEGNATRLTWKDTGSFGSNPVFRLFGPLMEGMLEDFFDKGLANVKAIAEKG